MARCVHPLFTLRKGQNPLILNGLILRAWGNGNNRIRPALLDLYQHKDEMGQVLGKRQDGITF